jgi:hypothetical protein
MVGRNQKPLPNIICLLIVFSINPQCNSLLSQEENVDVSILGLGVREGGEVQKSWRSFESSRALLVDK